MIKKITALVIALIMIISFSACGKKDNADTEFGWGAYKDNTYTNGFFNFSINLPDGYTQLSPQEIIDMNTTADENGIKHPINVNDIEDLSAEIIVHYVYCKKYEVAPLSQFNPYINIFSENMRSSNNLYNKEDYVENSINYTSMIFENAGVNVKVFPLEKPWISDRQFAKGSMQIEYDQFTMFQEMYALTKNNYTLVILIGYSNEAEKAELYSYIDSITIK